ncbi:MAG TPA: HlyD family efflux transporter periplasmic adaptor subunit [Haliangium sp.]|nr:HlyD family efflux transporter periplasmic adaptor subunit [Haliangium sp.]
MSSGRDANERSETSAPGTATAPGAPGASAPRQHRRARRTLGRWVKRIVLVALAVAALAALVTSFLPKPVSVDLAAATRGPMRVSVREDGKTQVEHRYVISAPIAGNLLRIDLEPGAPVAAGQVLARIVPAIPPLLDARTRAEAGARLDVALASQRQAAAQAEAARVAHELATREAERYRALGARNAMSQEAVDRAVYEARARVEDVASAEFAIKVAAHQVSMARAALGRMQGPRGQAASAEEIALESPIAGQVLKVFQESETVVAPGQMLIEVGDTRALEVVVDVLTRDAVHIVPGAAVTIERWGGDKPLEAHVHRVEPSAFTRLSALGVEEQRVNVVIDLDDPPEAWAALGDGYRVEVAITIWAADDVLTVPVSAVFRHGDAWAVYLDQGGYARLTPVEVGRRNQDRAQILSGLDAGARIILHPSDRVTDGVALLARHE